ncbi:MULTISPECIES: hypothetical protein [unclassified Oceanobacter]|uniref:hypothetical protein n=1 Tax=unclassified Oceanobacter TaxID=2620260 RepID=UPI0027334A8E|nr:MULTISPECIES: hypothetical protein [unclassified Oceanobacter]MDP2547101.1 hypothetical protein [Oceanobacter sp. 4_MG-2023]MDP2609726.1 hypothetical protein [Oceanobacter sp. 1_MG-2023]MDP2613057.1 hypothetical protein [Oceanobacter sp. 2_MG-2023]
MNNELTILKELAVVSVTRAEWLEIHRTVAGHVPGSDFSQTFEAMVQDVLKVYDFVGDILSPFVALNSVAAFEAGFDSLMATYQAGYLAEASKPRHYCDDAYEHFIEIQQSKVFNTRYPLLKHTFDRLDYIVDKFIANDAWLVMSIETVMKRLSRWLNGIAELKKSDGEDAFWVYQGLMASICDYLQLLSQRR